MHDHNLNNKIAIVTGGTRGLGRAIALNLARLGATVAMNYRGDEASAAKTLDEVRAIAHHLVRFLHGGDEAIDAQRKSSREIVRLGFQ